MSRLYPILFILAAAFSYAQVNLVVTTDKNDRDFRDDDPIVVNILLEVAGKDMIQQTPLRMFDTSRFEVVASGSEQNTLIDSKTGFRVNRTLYQYVLKPKKSGKLKIGSASVIVNDKLYHTEPFDIFVSETEKKVIADKTFSDIYLNVEFEGNEVYKNQPTVAVLRAYSRNLNSFRKVRNISFPDQDNLTVRQISSARSEIEPAGNISSQVLAVFLVYPSESGRLDIKPVTANLSSEKSKILSNKSKIKVKSLPASAPAGFKDAVGNFEVLLSHPGEKAEVDKPVKVSLKVRGEGNFDNMTFPRIKESVDYRFYTPKVITNTKASRAGVTGEVTADYLIIPQKAGPIKVLTDPFSYFNPQTGKYVDLGSREVLLEALTHNEILAARTPLEKVNDYTNTVLETVDSPVLKTTNLRVEERKTLNWNTVWINLGLMLTIVLGFLLFRKMRRAAAASENNRRKDLGTIAETESEIRARQLTDIGVYEPYLRQLNEDGQYDRFFQTIEEMDAALRKDYGAASNEEFKTMLEKTRGRQLAENYRSMRQRIQIEKYAPVHTHEYISELLDEAVNLYSQIKK
ncbi:BatD family protein [Marnyiella aurantia]|uniref:BatD family protein n=1 Tax=Marnyiella aurantia TaxID=2758037 RepID=A0A7D7QEJ1_9FLAO|nr:BatD family protein [Marnyiella aurantia]MBA5246369.1 BatD family protein [Marnyiella aurantia]QMS98261.1 BatD family protein [Marnyiella aurantia]